MARTHEGRREEGVSKARWCPQQMTLWWMRGSRRLEKGETWAGQQAGLVARRIRTACEWLCSRVVSIAREYARGRPSHAQGAAPEGLCLPYLTSTLHAHCCIAARGQAGVQGVVGVPPARVGACRSYAQGHASSLLPETQAPGAAPTRGAAPTGSLQQPTAWTTQDVCVQVCALSRLCGRPKTLECDRF